MKKFILLAFILTGLTMNSFSKWHQKDFIITMWCPPPATNENFNILTRDGYNLTNVSLIGDQAIALHTSTDSIKKLLDIAGKNNLKTLFSNTDLFQSATLDNPVQKLKLDSIIEVLKNHPSFEGYYITDEPTNDIFYKYSRFTDYLKSKDSFHLIYINLLPCTAKLKILSNDKAVILKSNPILYSRYLNSSFETFKQDIFSYDHYIFKKNIFGSPKTTKQYFENLELIRTVALDKKIPFMNIIQACTIEKDWRLPTEVELRWQAYTTMAYGAHGISWFLYWGPTSYGGCYQEGKRMPIADLLAEINQDIKILGPELMKLTSTHVYHSGKSLPRFTTRIPSNFPIQITGGEFILGMFSQNDLNGLENTFMIMNRDVEKIAKATITLHQGNGTLKKFVIHKKINPDLTWQVDSSWEVVQPLKNGSSIHTDIPQGGGTLFKIDN